MKTKEETIQSNLKQYFASARGHKCPPSMKHNLYNQLDINTPNSWWSPRLVASGLTLAFVASIVFNITTKNKQQQIDQAQEDLQIAMHYINRVSFKPLSAVTNKGIKPGVIMPLSRSVASL